VDGVLACVRDVAVRGLAGRLGATAQANLHRTPEDVERLLDAGVHIRLVKGAYVEQPDRALPYGEFTDIAYLRLAHRLAAADAPFALATHDGVLREALLAALGPVPVEQLLGVRPDVVDDLTARGVPVRVYVTFGHNWFRYWMRRIRRITRRLSAPHPHFESPAIRQRRHDADCSLGLISRIGPN
jgi:proline dehydrogenase